MCCAGWARPTCCGLAWTIARAPPHEGAPDEAGRRPLRFWQAALFQWVNPKAWIIAIGAVVTYTQQPGRFGQSIFLAIIFGAVCLPCVLFWTGVGAGAARVLRTQRALRRFDLVMAALLVASLLPLLIE